MSCMPCPQVAGFSCLLFGICPSQHHDATHLPHWHSSCWLLLLLGSVAAGTSRLQTCLQQEAAELAAFLDEQQHNNQRQQAHGELAYLSFQALR